MSDFDREEERERLREKYERDQEKRQSTQRMSELLLRGATMTDSHCDDCGDPIFRYEGQEFCATCQAEGVPESGDAATGEAGETQAIDESETAQRADPEPSLPAENGQTPPSPSSRPEREPAERTAPEPTARERPATDDRRREAGTGTGDGDLQAARDSLARTVARFARRAEETDSPREATDHLAAAREAAEALAALDRR